MQAIKKAVAVVCWRRRSSNAVALSAPCRRHDIVLELDLDLDLDLDMVWGGGFP